MVRPVIGALALALALAGCGGDPKADPTPTPSAPVTTPVSTTPAPPVMPEAAKANTKAGAIAFVRYYVELINHAQATGETESLAAVESEKCRSCKQARSAVDEIYASGGHIEGGDWHADTRSVTRRPDIQGWTVLVIARFGAQSIVRPAGTTSLKGGQSLITFVLRRETNWQVLQWSRAS